MATIDPSIPLGVRPVEIPNQLAQFAQLAQIQGAQQQNSLLQMQMDKARREENDLQALRTGLAAPDADPYKVLLQAGKVKEAQEYQASQRTAQTQRLELENKTIAMYRDASQAITDPQSAVEFVTHMHTDPRLKESPIAQVPLEQALAKIPKDPAAFDGWKKEFALGATKFIELNKPTTNVVSAGGTSQVLQTPGLGGAPQTVGTIAHTPTAADIEAARHHGVIEAQGEATLSKPFEVTDPNTGSAVLVQQGKAGNLTPVPGYAPKGGGKPLPQAALKQITEVRDNANTIDRLATSFKPEFSEKGVYGFGADASLAAKGVMGTDQEAVQWWKNYRKQAELVERHAMFGAALTPGEQASWRNADIGPGMHPDTIKANLKTRQELAAKMLDTTRQDLIDAGHSEQRVNAIAGRGPKAPDAPAPAAAGGIPLVNAKGWTLHTDAKGNRAYVSPDGKQFEAVK